MNKRLVRVVSFFLLPTLFADSARAAIPSIFDRSPVHEIRLEGLYLNQALATTAGSFAHPGATQHAAVALDGLTRREATQAFGGSPFLGKLTRVFDRFHKDKDLRASVPSQALTLNLGDDRPVPEKAVPYTNIVQGNLDATTGGLGGVSWKAQHGLRAHPFISNPTDKVFPGSAIAVYEKDDHGTWASPLNAYPGNRGPDNPIWSWRWILGLWREKSATLRRFHPYTQYEYPPAPGKATTVTVRRFSPLLPGNADETSLPIELTQIQVENLSSVDREISVLIPLDNIVGDALQFVDPFEEIIPNGDNQGYTASDQGLYKGIVMGLKPGQSAPDARLAGQMGLFVEQQRGMTVERTVFDTRDGSAMAESFAKTGDVQDLRKTTPVGKEQAAAIVVKLTLKAGERRTINSSASFDFPNDVRNGKQFKRYYTNKVGTEGTHAAPLAIHGLKNIGKWTKAIDVWQQKVLSVPNVPDYVKTTALNELYFLFGGGTLFTKEGHIYFLEGPDPRLLNTLDVWFYTPMLAQFFPDLEQDIILGFAEQVPVEDKTIAPYINPSEVFDAQGNNVTGTTYGLDPKLEHTRLATPDRPFDINGPDKGYRKVAGAVEHHRDDSVLGPVSTDPKVDNRIGRSINRYLQDHNTWKDLAPKFVLQAWRAYDMDPARKKAFLEKVWPDVVIALAHQEKFDIDGDGLPDHGGYPDWTYDDWSIKGPTTYTAILTLSSLAAAIAIAEELGKGNDPVVVHYREWLERGKKSVESKLWNPTKHYFNIAEGNDDIMADAMAGIVYMKEFGLEARVGPIVPDDQVVAHLHAVYDNNFLKFEKGQRGVINGAKADGSPTKAQAAEVWIGTQRMIAALMVRMGMKAEGDQIMKVDYDNMIKDGRFLERTPEAINSEGKSRFTTYMRGGAVWFYYLASRPLRSSPLNLAKPARRFFLNGFQHAVLLLALVFALKAQPLPPANQGVIQQGIAAATLAVKHMEIDSWAPGPNRVSVIAFLKRAVAGKDFKPIPGSVLNAAVDDPPSNTILLNPDLFPKRSEEERAAILAHEGFHGANAQQRRRSRFMVWWDAEAKKHTGLQIARDPGLSHLYKQNLAAITRNEVEALNFDLAYRISLARSRGYKDMRMYFRDLANIPGNPDAPFQRNLADFLSGWDISKPETVRYKQDEMMLGLFLNRFAPHYDTRILSEIAAGEGARQGADTISYTWFLSWLKDPAYYNPVIPDKKPARFTPNSPKQNLILRAS